MGRRGGKKSGRGNQRHFSGKRGNYQEVVRENEKLERYYNALEIVDSSSRDEFWEALRRDLPYSFRFAGSKGYALSVQKLLRERYIPEITAIDSYEGEKVEPPYPIPWYPDGLAWAMNTPKHVIRRYKPFTSFKKFLVSETSVGNISRQEAVSMIPPLLMDVSPGMIVLDLCAAPGSKAAQLIEMLHFGEEERIQAIRKIERKRAAGEANEAPKSLTPGGDDGDANGFSQDDGRSTGLLIANDADYKRSQMLIHQMKRLNSPNLIVTNHDATMFPSLKLPPSPESSKPQGKSRFLKFDRILADVPCSGDGTMRKNPSIWKDWTPGNSLGLHLTQCRILVRALQMLKVGGRVVYSTCSMNPIENEAVVASAINRCGGPAKVRILDCTDRLPSLKRKPGLRQWEVMDKHGKIWSEWAQVESQRSSIGVEGTGRLVESMFPMSYQTVDEGSAAGTEIPLERCMRVYGHMQDTGAFFIAVLEKTSEIKAKPEASQAVPEPSGSIVPAISAIEAASDDVNGATDPQTSIEMSELLDSTLRPASSTNIDTSGTERQLEENLMLENISPGKRTREDGGAVDHTSAPKKPRTAGEPQEITSSEPDPRLAQPRQSPSPPKDEAVPLDPSATFDAGPKKVGRLAFEEPFKYLSPEHDELKKVYDFYSLSPRFPRNRFMVRNATGDPVKTIYYTTDLARDILSSNESRGVKFVHCGVKMFMKQDVQKPDVCSWRIQLEGMPVIEPWVGEERTVRLNKRETLRKLLVEMFPKVGGGAWEELGEIGERVRDMEMGCCILRVESSDDENGFREDLALPLWRSMYSLNLMLPKEDRKAMLLRVFNDETPLQAHVSKQKGSPAAGDADTADVSINMADDDAQGDMVTVENANNAE